MVDEAGLARDLLRLNATFFFADVDVVFLRDPLPYLRAQLVGGAQLLFHTDGFGPSAHALAHPESLELPSHGWRRLLRRSKRGGAAKKNRAPMRASARVRRR